ncbi:alpha/beta hydrolase [Flavobacterium psychrophilum]|uniref:alpha/beta fold hydrolase n=1 Tax=Flavobacterium psychrophilum TaxID=96345 RepID=UPI000B7C5409|nr:alpha/beta hydrolase [Flavobacterium psychrophilum]ELY2016419.1 alpha/beta hydrolase [Flavobacterium psychrophilum]MBF2024020.1 alpha/beta hydrolase [Flavobacterium psychrophilum]MCB5984735.1 alpha/beta hydrolase [Flavobacterium psychrophilum]MCB6070609.1 alpha/beta hydrolase [Flavobacterium psychrophilum]MCB6097662.1 alpha/beta hydrolase [Flavobacterium psychrophilum]
MKKTSFLLILLLTSFVCQSQKFENINILKIDTTEIVQIGGIKQFISIKGNNKENPILLFLHGGPGTSLVESSEKFTEKLKNEFVVVNWDQRETGETGKINSVNENLTPEFFKNDAYELIKYVLDKFKHKKLYLVSHSWGSVLGFDIAEKHSELLYAYIPISPIVDQNKASKLTMEMLNNWAIKTKDSNAITELNLVKIPFENQNDLFYSQKWLFIHNGVEFARKEDFKTNYYKWLATWFPIWKKSTENNLFETLRKINCPIYFIEGNGDKLKSHYIVKDYFEFIKAPKKKMFWMKKSGHTVYNSEPEKLQKIIIEKIKPETL